MVGRYVDWAGLAPYEGELTSVGCRCRLSAINVDGGHHGCQAGMVIAMAEDLLTVPEACQLLGVSRAWLYRVLQKHPLVKYRAPLGRAVLYRRSDLERLRTPKADRRR